MIESESGTAGWEQLHEATSETEHMYSSSSLGVAKTYFGERQRRPWLDISLAICKVDMNEQ